MDIGYERFLLPSFIENMNSYSKCCFFSCYCFYRMLSLLKKKINRSTSKGQNNLLMIEIVAKKQALWTFNISPGFCSLPICSFCIPFDFNHFWARWFDRITIISEFFYWVYCSNYTYEYGNDVIKSIIS